MKPIVRVEHLSKQYRLGTGAEPYSTLRESIIKAVRRPLAALSGDGKQRQESFWALEDVNFEVAEGEVVGIIGRNGAGKSTLLKILSRITEPTTGRVELYGRVGSLLEVGTGFHGELTGRENIYLNGAILGMRRHEIARKFDEIVEFADVEKFLETPVKRYSSGMYVRLAFAVAAHLEPEILIIDEVLAVGDAEFQKKCLGKMSEVAAQGRTVLFVSHNLGAVSTLTSRCLFLSDGQLRFMGSTTDAIREYTAQRKVGNQVYRADATSEKPNITRVEIFTSEPNNIHTQGKEFRIEFDVNLPFETGRLGVAFRIINDLSQAIVASWAYPGDKPLFKKKGRHTVTCVIPQLRLYKGRYSLKVGLADERGAVLIDHLSDICSFEVDMYGLSSGHPLGWLPDACIYIEDCEWIAA